MPFKSKAQAAYLYKYHPEIAKRWRKEYPSQDISKLPKKKESKKNG